MKKTFVCVCCDSKWFCVTQKQLIEHYRVEHPSNPQTLYDAIGETWDSTLTELIRAQLAANSRVRTLEAENMELKKQWRAMADRWTAIQLIVRGGP
jgi:hypothetical protein